MNAIDTPALFTEVTPNESAVVNGGFTGLGGFDFQGRFYNRLFPLLPNPWIFPQQVRSFGNVVGFGSLNAFLQGGSLGQTNFLLAAARRIGGF